MKKILFLILLASPLLCSWGFFAHKKINHLAVFILPREMIGFYKRNIDYITEHAVDPDKRRYIDSAEAPRHFLDADRYGAAPFDSIPQKWADAVARYTIDSVNRSGIVPWAIARTYYRLVQAFKDRDSLKILRYSADLGHYVADAHVPLHMTSNYNGQKTRQTGIHAFWESRLPELYAQQYNFYVGKAVYIDDPLKFAWQICRETYNNLDSVLLIEKHLLITIPQNQQYTFIKTNTKIIRNYAEPFAFAFHEQMKGMVEKQMQKSVLAVGSYWFSAWVDAGQPKLTRMLPRELTADEKMIENLENYHFESGKIIGRAEQ